MWALRYSSIQAVFGCAYQLYENAASSGQLQGQGWSWGEGQGGTRHHWSYLDLNYRFGWVCWFDEKGRFLKSTNLEYYSVTIFDVLNPWHGSPDKFLPNLLRDVGWLPLSNHASSFRTLFIKPLDLWGSTLLLSICSYPSRWRCHLWTSQHGSKTQLMNYSKAIPHILDFRSLAQQMESNHVSYSSHNLGICRGNKHM